MTRKEKAEFQHKLRNLLLDYSETDEQFFLTLLYANDVINTELQYFNDIFERGNEHEK